MKRSEMLDKIWDFIDKAQREKVCLDKMDCHILLYEMEKSGMMPPFCEKIYLRSWRQGGDGHQWEKEDE